MNLLDAIRSKKTIKSPNGAFKFTFISESDDLGYFEITEAGLTYISNTLPKINAENILSDNWEEVESLCHIS